MSSQSTVKNFSFGFMKTIITMVVSLIGTPLLLQYIDAESFGTFKTLTEVLGYFQLLEIGLYSTLLNLMIKSVAQSDHQMTAQIQAYGLRKYLNILLIILLAGALLFPFQHLLYKDSSIISFQSNTAYLILLLTFIFLPWNVLKAELETSQKIYHIHLSILISAVITTSLSIILSYYSYGLIGLAFAQLIGVFAANVYISIIQWNSSKKLLHNVSPAKLSDEIQKNSSIFQKANFLNELSGKVCLFSDQILISIIMGAKNVVPYFITQRLIFMALSQLQSIPQSSWASLGDKFHKTEEDLFKRNVLLLTKFVSLLSCTTLLPIFILNKEFITKWVGLHHFGGELLTGLTCLNAYLLALFSVWGWTFAAASTSNTLTKMMWTQAIVNLLASLYFTKTFGLTGPAIGTLIACVLVPLIQIPLLMRSTFKFSIRELTRQWLPPLILGLIFLPVFYWSKSLISFNDWGRIILGLSGMAILYLASAYFSILNMEERVWFTSLVKRKLKLI